MGEAVATKRGVPFRRRRSTCNFTFRQRPQITTDALRKCRVATIQSYSSGKDPGAQAMGTLARLTSSQPHSTVLSPATIKRAQKSRGDSRDEKEQCCIHARRKYGSQPCKNRQCSPQSHPFCVRKNLHCCVLYCGCCRPAGARCGPGMPGGPGNMPMGACGCGGGWYPW